MACVKVEMWGCFKVSWFGNRCHERYLLGSLASISNKSINLAMAAKYIRKHSIKALISRVFNDQMSVMSNNQRVLQPYSPEHLKSMANGTHQTHPVNRMDPIVNISVVLASVTVGKIPRRFALWPCLFASM